MPMLTAMLGVAVLTIVESSICMKNENATSQSSVRLALASSNGPASPSATLSVGRTSSCITVNYTPCD